MFSTIFNNLESSAVHHNESAPFLVEKALMRKEGDLTDNTQAVLQKTSILWTQKEFITKSTGVL